MRHIDSNSFDKSNPQRPNFGQKSVEKVTY
jgi:hypothetical protein